MPSATPRGALEAVTLPFIIAAANPTAAAPPITDDAIVRAKNMAFIGASPYQVTATFCTFLM